MVHEDNQNTDDHVEDLWRHRKEDEFEKVVLSLQESTYKKTPLGRSCIRGHKLPEYMHDGKYRHGVKTSECSEDAKRLIYPLGNSSADNVNDLHQPGQQKRRNYNWPVDPTTTTFGVKGETGIGRGSSSGVASALQMKDGRCVESTKEAKRSIDSDKVFGKSTCQSNDSAADCLGHAGDAADNTQDIDDLGKSLTPGFRNVETSRAFGTPSIRTDIPKYDRSSVADLQNYGDDCNAAYLLRPSVFSSLGLDEDEFDKPRTKKCLKRLVMNCGLLEGNDEFEYLYEQVTDRDQGVSINGFLCILDSRHLTQCK